jgi:hypothetical protein
MGEIGQSGKTPNTIATLGAETQAKKNKIKVD